MLPGYADVHVKFAIVNGLRRRGMDVVTAQERGQRTEDDSVLLAAATAENRLMLTNDEDFLREHSAWMAAGKSHAGIVFWQQQKPPIGEVIRRILDYATRTSPAEAANTVKFLYP
jgi:hypothetical protein